VIKSAQGNRGNVFNVREYDLKFKIVTKKFKDVKQEEMPDINNPKIINAMEDGAKLMKEVLNGGYSVHPVPPPNSDIIESIIRANDKNNIKIEKLFILG
jgi:hypothetical protein